MFKIHHHAVNALRIAAAVLLLSCTLSVRAFVVYALTDTNTIQVFASNATGTPLHSSIPAAGIPVTGLQGGESLLAIDFRPATAELYGIGSTSRLYKIDVQYNELAPPATATAQLVGSGPFTPALSGAKFGMAFTPVADRIRITSDAEQNLRLNPITAVAVVDTSLSPAGNIVEIAYDRTYPGASATTLFAIDSSTDSLYRIGSVDANPTSPNGGALTLIGACGSNFGNSSALASYNNRLFSIMTVSGNTTLYELDPATGALIDGFGALSGNPAILAMAVQPESASVSKAAIKIHFDGPDQDSIAVRGTLAVDTAFDPANKAATLYVGGVPVHFTLDAKGKGALDVNRLSIKTKRVHGDAVSATFKGSIKKATISSAMAAYGLVNSDIDAATVHVPVAISIGSLPYVCPGGAELTYRAVADVIGIAK